MSAAKARASGVRISSNGGARAPRIATPEGVSTVLPAIIILSFLARGHTLRRAAETIRPAPAKSTAQAPVGAARSGGHGVARNNRPFGSFAVLSDRRARGSADERRLASGNTASACDQAAPLCRRPGEIGRAAGRERG